jgi:hypothetical protein
MADARIRDGQAITASHDAVLTEMTNIKKYETVVSVERKQQYGGCIKFAWLFGSPFDGDN